MGLYFKKSVSVGPFRFNLSNGGVGISVGVPGFRIGTSPRGNYVHVGRGGLYYRATLPRKRPAAWRPELPPESIHRAEVAMEEIESADAATIVDSDSAELIAEMHAKRRKLRIWPWVLALGIGACVWIAGRWPSLPDGLIGGLLVLVLAATLSAALFDQIRKTTVLMYDFEPGTEKGFEQLHGAFDAFASCARRWHISARGQVRDRKYHAGASSLVKRHAITVGTSNPPYVKTNVPVPFIPVGKQTLYFLPDLVLVFEPNAVGAVSYSNLSVQTARTRFIEEESVPRDAEVVDRTWRYVNKRGGPDRRFKDNRELPVVLYEEVTFASESGLNEVLQVSRAGVAEGLARALSAQRVAELARTRTAR